MKKISKKIIQISTAIFIGAVLSIGASYVSALTTRPSDINTNAPKTIDVSATGQSKGDTNNPSGGQLSLKNLIVGFVASGQASTDSDPQNFSRINDLGYMSVGRAAPGSGIALDIKGKDGGAKGTIRALRLAHTEDAKVPVCAGPDGKLELCGENLEYNPVVDSNGDYESAVYPLVIPDGVSSVSVTILGAGGAGYGENNNKTYRDDGDASFFAGENVYLFAEGGKGADSFVTVAEGGNATSTPTSTNSRVVALSLYDGGNGGTVSASYSGNSSVVKTGTCNSTTYYVIQGGAGGAGASGGASYQGSQVSGGAGSSGGPMSGSNWGFVLGSVDSGGTYINCSLLDKTSDDQQQSGEENNRIGGNGTNGALGDGGSGFGGQGGVSAISDDSNCSNFSNPFICLGSYGGGGGGAGAHIRATINVNKGEIFYIKTGRGGVPQYTACIGSSKYTCQKSKLAGGGAVSGKGGNGKVIVQFDYNS